MPLRLLEAIVPGDRGQDAVQVLEAHAAVSITSEKLSEHRTLVRALLDSERTEAVMDQLEDRFQCRDDFRVLVFAIEATVPRPNAPNPSPPPSSAMRWRISREELYADLVEATQTSPVYVATVALSSVVAAVGLIKSSVAVIIGAMVIAPLLGPNMALALGSTLGDTRLIGPAIRTAGIGYAVTLTISVVIGAVFPLDPSAQEIASRTSVGMSDLALALAAGSAGALAVTTGAPAALIGVMVAVALLPPLVAFGLLLGHGMLPEASGAALLFATNIVCVLFAGVLTFVAQGIRPRTWWEVDRARRATVAAILSTAVMLAAIVAIVLLAL